MIEPDSAPLTPVIGAARREFPWNPFAGLENAREVFAWGMYDLANQSFQLLINTLLFSIYFTNVIAPDSATGDRWWGYLAGLSLLLVTVLSPGVGAAADARSIKKPLLLVTGVACSLLIIALTLLGPGDVAAAALIFTPAAILCGLGENLLGAFLPQISTPRTIGRISAIGFTMSYFGALMLLGITAAAVWLLGLSSPDSWRPLFAFAGVWFLAGTIPAMFLLNEGVNGARLTGNAQPRGTLQRLVRTIRETRRFRQVIRLFIADFVFQMGILAVVFFAGRIAQSMGAGVGSTLRLALVMTIAAGCAAVIVGRIQDRIGHRRTVMASLTLWAVSTGVLVVLQIVNADPRWFWGIAAGWGLGLGASGTAVRAMVGAFTPAGRAAEFFGLFGMVNRLGGVVGVPLFGIVKSAAGDAAALAMLTGFFVLGAMLVLRVNEAEGIGAAGHNDL